MSEFEQGLKALRERRGLDPAPAVTGDFHRRTGPPPCSLPVNLDGIPPWVHGSRLGREHRDIQMHLAEDHGRDPGWAENASNGTAHGTHDYLHGRDAAYAEDLPHGEAESR